MSYQRLQGTGFRKQVRTWVYVASACSFSSFITLIFEILGGLGNGPPLNNVYYFQATTSRIAGARRTTRWYYFELCGGGGFACGNFAMAPLGAWPSKAVGVPASIAGTADGNTVDPTLYALWVAAWWLTLISLILLVVKLVDLNQHMGLSGMRPLIGRIWRYGPVVVYPIAFALRLKPLTAFTSALPDASIGVGFGLAILTLLLLIAGEVCLFRLRKIVQRFSLQSQQQRGALRQPQYDAMSVSEYAMSQPGVQSQYVSRGMQHGMQHGMPNQRARSIY